MVATSKPSSIWDIDIKTEEGLKELKSHLQNGGDPNELGYLRSSSGGSEYKGTLLIEAAFWEYIEVVKILVEFSAETNCSHLSRGTPLMIAAGLGNRQLCELLIGHGADVNFLWVNRYCGIPGTCHVRGSSLHRAAKNGRAEIIQLLVEHSADTEVAVDVIPVIGTYDSAIAAAARGGYLESVQALIAGDADVNFQHPWGYSALHNAASYGHFEIVQYLVEQGAEVNQRGGVFGMTPLYLVQGRSDRRDIEQYLKAHDGITYIHWWYYALMLIGFSFSGFGP